MQTAGVDSGMTQSTTVISGMQGQWQESSSNFSNITGSGLLGFRTGFNSALYSIYLRRDGTLPMTGNLNMGGNNINNAKILLRLVPVVLVAISPLEELLMQLKKLSHIMVMEIPSL